MSDKPFKMQGHTLPGPNQKSALKMTEEDLWTQVRGGKTQEEYRASLSGASGAVGRDKANETGGSSMPTPTAVQAISGENMNRIVNERSNANIDSGIGGDDVSGVDDVKKKKVDVEVTVNGQQV